MMSIQDTTWEIAFAVTRHRKAEGLSQRELAKLAGLTVSTISRVESGAVLPNIYTLSKIFKALRIGFTLEQNGLHEWPRFYTLG